MLFMWILISFDGTWESLSRKVKSLRYTLKRKNDHLLVDSGLDSDVSVEMQGNQR